MRNLIIMFSLTSFNIRQKWKIQKLPDVCCQSVQVETSPWTLGMFLKYCNLKLNFYYMHLNTPEKKKQKKNGDGIRILAGSDCGCVSAPLLVHIQSMCPTLSDEGDFSEARWFFSLVLTSGAEDKHLSLFVQNRLPSDQPSSTFKGVTVYSSFQNQLCYSRWKKPLSNRVFVLGTAVLISALLRSTLLLNP